MHQNLNMNSVFVSSQDGSWKIGCMEKVNFHLNFALNFLIQI